MGMPGYVALFFGNVLSVSILTWLLMPLVNRAFAFWLWPSRARSDAYAMWRALIVMVCWAVFLLVSA